MIMEPDRYARALLVTAVLTLGGCALRVPAALQSPPTSFVVTSGGPNNSATYLARLDSGIVLFDLGWWGAPGAIAHGLRQLGGTTDDVIAVFVTHSHRDHIGAWRSVREARFHMAEAEVDLFFGRQQHGGWIPRLADELIESDRPGPGEIAVRTFSSDTAFVFGSDTVHAFLVPGHTPGSAAYLFRGTLFAGDAIAWSWMSRFRVARGGYSEDTNLARQSLESLRQRLKTHRVEWVCTAHLKCGTVSEAFWTDLLEKSTR
jgi:glyoxylase-like metal-dependent hydrolase (beta-lactamase superfamily II)